MHRSKSNPYPLLVAALLTVAVGCSRQNESAAESATSANAPAMSADAGALPELPVAEERAAFIDSVQQPGVDAGGLASSATTVTDPSRRFVRTADASFQVRDVYAATLAIEDAVAAEGGFVVKNAISSNEYDRIERAVGDGKLLQLSQVVTEGSLVVRVPSERTQPFLRVIARQMQFLDARTFEANDVQFDLLRRHLAQARAQELQQDIRAAGTQSGKTGEKIDAAQAREQALAARDAAVVEQRELEDRIAFSTLTLQLKQPAQVREQVVPDTEAILRARGPGFLSEVRAAVAAGWRGLLEMVVAMVHLWPLLLLLAAGWWVFRRIRRWHGVRPAPRPPAASEARTGSPTE